MTVETTPITPWLNLSASIVLGSCAQISLKRGLGNAGQQGQRRASIVSPWVLLWALAFVAATILWISALRTLDLSYAYPLLGLGYVLVTVLAALFLKEKVSKTHWLAVAMIATGAALVARSF